MKKIMSIILAAGTGTRMNSKNHKVLHKILDKTLIQYVVEATKEVQSEKDCVIVGYMADEVKSNLEKYEALEFPVQSEQKGTGHAVLMAKNFIDENSDVIILCGDTPLLKSSMLKKLVESHQNNNNDITLATCNLDDPSGYGRINKENGKITKIVEHKDCDENQLKITEINTGVYIFKGDVLLSLLGKIKNDNVKGEYYLTDTIEIALSENKTVESIVFDNPEQFNGINTKLQLHDAAKLMRERINKQHMENGVVIVDSNTTYISKDVKIEKDTVIYQNCQIFGSTTIGEDCEIGPNTNINTMKIGNGVSILNSTTNQSSIDDNTTVGPYAYVRPNSEIGKNVKIGDFVEVKKAKIGNNTKASHLTYIGDSVVGENVNFGCGTITVNYDGKNKFLTTVEDNVFIGSNVNLIAPVTIEKNSKVAAGTTVTKKVPSNALAIGRVKQDNKENYVR
ncbi:MAG: bifunctional UDP-N-acetylglucosamine diphosphorylase/glucosamine-1-phosphate N-acetyltransferase GlmU [Lachnospirales bacterium]